jgi:hypothetical protein
MRARVRLSERGTRLAFFPGDDLYGRQLRKSVTESSLDRQLANERAILSAGRKSGRRARARGPTPPSREALWAFYSDLSSDL